ncbi:MAG: thioredoxin [Desulfobacteraceae bacterium]|nr:thioredoxin [Desulfobacteraceae bacterium]
MSKAVAVPVTLAAVAALAFLATANICPDCRSNPANDLVENDEATTGELIANLNVDNFSASIAEGVTLVDFWAPWCGPCKMQGPILEQVAESIDGRAKIAKLNVDNAGEVAGRFGVQAIPTLLLFKDGNEVRRFVGVQPKEILIDAISSAI